MQNSIRESIIKLKTINKDLNAVVEWLQNENDEIRFPSGPLSGIPFSIKECYAIKGHKITSASKRMIPIDCIEDAEVVAKLKQAGAIPIARGNTSEFLLGRETNNLLYGTTNNYINNSLTAGGSSGGDGSMAASGAVAFSIGTDIGGSCRYPAYFNGISGFRPASGQISKAGVFPAAGNDFVETMNSPGIMSSSIKIIREVYNVIGNKPLRYSDQLSHLKWYSAKDFDVKVKDESIQMALKASYEKVKSNGFNFKDISIPESGKLYNTFASLMCGGFTHKIYEWSITTEGKKLSFLGELWGRIKGEKTISDELFSMLLPFNLLTPSAASLSKKIEYVKDVRKKYFEALGSEGILILPTAGILAPQHKKFIPQYSKPGIIQIITPISFCNVLNLSSITIPAKKYLKSKDTHPPGILLIAREGNEENLLNAAEWLEGVLK